MNRTLDLRIASAPLSQLSYSPVEPPERLELPTVSLQVRRSALELWRQFKIGSDDGIRTRDLLRDRQAHWAAMLRHCKLADRLRFELRTPDLEAGVLPITTTSL